MPKAAGAVKWKHEDWSQAMVSRLIDQSSKIDMDSSDIKFINQLIDGSVPGVRTEKRFLFDIVSNKTNSIDVDKYDYMVRDTRNVGMVGYDVSRLMNNSRIVEDEIAYAYKQPEEIIDFFATRNRLHRRIYGHRAAKAIEFMHVDALLEANEELGISAAVINGDWEAFESFDDTIFNDIRRRGKTNEGLKKARDILLRIDRRELYRFVDEYLIPTDLRNYVNKELGNVTARHIAACAEASANVKEEDIIVQFHKLAYHPLGDDVNPLHRVKFYTKYEPDKPIGIASESISNLIPEVFGETKVRCFCRSNNLQVVINVQKAFRKHMDELNEQLGRELLGSRLQGPFAPARPRDADSMDEDVLDDLHDTRRNGLTLAYTPTRPSGSQTIRTLNSSGHSVARNLWESTSAPAGYGEESNPFSSIPATPSRDSRIPSMESPGKRLTCNPGLTVPEDAAKVVIAATPVKNKKRKMNNVD
ncbi:hypothetical protein HDU93_002363 [Gonapodya sp. JEL0774]|nr:hypothetical protein HDU93_002363 [Gonapodya sp. JEL0774]